MPTFFNFNAGVISPSIIFVPSISRPSIFFKSSMNFIDGMGLQLSKYKNLNSFSVFIISASTFLSIKEINMNMKTFFNNIIRVDKNIVFINCKTVFTGYYFY